MSERGITLHPSTCRLMEVTDGRGESKRLFVLTDLHRGQSKMQARPRSCCRLFADCGFVRDGGSTRQAGVENRRGYSTAVAVWLLSWSFQGAIDVVCTARHLGAAVGEVGLVVKREVVLAEDVVWPPVVAAPPPAAGPPPHSREEGTSGKTETGGRKRGRASERTLRGRSAGTACRAFQNPLCEIVACTQVPASAFSIVFVSCATIRVLRAFCR